MHPRLLVLGALALCACSDPVTPTDPATPPAPPTIASTTVAPGDSLYETIDLGLTNFSGTAFLTPAGDVFYYLENTLVRWHEGVATPFSVGGGGFPPTLVAVNASGAITGYYQLPNSEYRSFIWQNGVTTQLGTLGAIRVYAADINDHGAVVGKEIWADGTTRAFLWNAGRLHDLGGNNSGASTARKINRRGEILGTLVLSDPAGVQHAVIWRHQVMTDLGPLMPTSAGYNVYPSDLAQDGTVVGYGYVPGFANTQAAFRSVGDSLETLPRLDISGSADAMFVNGRREIAGAGYYMDAGDSPQGYLWRDGVPTSLGGIPSFPSDTGPCEVCGKSGMFVRAMNDSGVIIGRATVGFNHSAAFVWQKGVIARLPGLGGGYAIALAVNASGVIVGIASDSGQYHPRHVVLWRPRGAPTAVAARP